MVWEPKHNANPALVATSRHRVVTVDKRVIQELLLRCYFIRTYCRPLFLSNLTPTQDLMYLIVLPNTEIWTIYYSLTRPHPQSSAFPLAVVNIISTQRHTFQARFPQRQQSAPLCHITDHIPHLNTKLGCSLACPRHLLAIRTTSLRERRTAIRLCAANRGLLATSWSKTLRRF